MGNCLSAEYPDRYDLGGSYDGGSTASSKRVSRAPPPQPEGAFYVGQHKDRSGAGAATAAGGNTGSGGSSGGPKFDTEDDRETEDQLKPPPNAPFAR